MSENTAPNFPSFGGDTVSRAEFEALQAELKAALTQRDEARAKLPDALIPAHAGGPGNDNHQASWSQAEQEAAQRGEVLDHWKV